MGGVHRGPPGPEALSSQGKPPGRGEAGWGSGNQSCPSRLCPPPGPGPHGGLDGDLHQPSSARTRPGSLLWTGVVDTRSGSYWPPSCLLAGPHDHGQERGRPQDAGHVTPPTARMRLWSCVLTLANRSAITAPLYHPPPSPGPSSLGPEPTLPDGWAAAQWAGWVGHLGTRGSLNLPRPALLVTRLHPRVQLRAWPG